MKIHVELPRDRTKTGALWVLSDNGETLYGPRRCRGKADNAEAASHGNPSRDPTRPFGDHPSGAYRVVLIEDGKLPAHSYGHHFLLLDPTAGDALVAKRNGREGLALHDGDLNPDGSLRATEGCLRVDPDTSDAVVALLRPTLALAAVSYECVDRP